MQPSFVQLTVSDDDVEQSEYGSDKEDSGASECGAKLTLIERESWGHKAILKGEIVLRSEKM